MEFKELNAAEVAQVLGTSAEYRVSEVADRKAGIVLRINKDRLKTLAPAAKQLIYRIGSDQFSSDSFTLCRNWCAMAPSTTR
jgi:hypothetical protein